MTWGIYCVETVWEDPASTLSVLPMLELLRRRWQMPFIHRDAVTQDEFFHHLENWHGMDDYPILYLGYHGNSRGIWLDENQKRVANNQILLSKIALVLEGKCKNRVVHFGSCSTVDVENKDTKELGKLTGVSAVSGYATDVDWMYSLAFELLYFETIQWIQWQRDYSRLSRDRMRECRTLLNKKAYVSLRHELGFNVFLPRTKS